MLFRSLGNQPVVAPPMQYRNLEEKPESHGHETQEDINTEEYPPSPSDSNIYRWTDENGVIHITNDKDSIPIEYREQLQQGTNEETQTTRDKNKTKSKSINKTTE